MKKLDKSLVAKQLIGEPPHDRQQLALWIELFLDLQMPEKSVCSHHATPLDYLEHAFFEHPADPVVWACRGGGKTTIGAVATLLDLLFKPGIQIRILGGSFEQSEKMYAYLLQLIHRHFSFLLKSPPTQRRLQLLNGSRVQVLAQSDRSVRGQRVQKLRCDEVELFDPAVWQAAQLATRSIASTPESENPCEPPTPIRGTVEVFSTMHKPAGLMNKILNAAAQDDARKTFAWCVWDVIENCPPERPCSTCPLWEHCQGRAKTANGFLKIDDVIAMKNRVSASTWEHEMLCHPPRLEHGVFPAFRRELHVRSAEGYPLLPGAKFMLNGHHMLVENVVAGVDFGYRGAFVSLWLAMIRVGAKPDGPRLVWVCDELVTRQQTLACNAAAMRERRWDPVTVYCDIAGRQTSSQTGRTDERVLRDAGFPTKARAMRIDEGLGMIADLVQPASGLPRFYVDPRCAHLIEAMESYERGEDGKAIKDGVHDHLIDALRYALVGHDDRGSRTEVTYYIAQ